MENQRRSEILYTLCTDRINQLQSLRSTQYISHGLPPIANKNQYMPSTMSLVFNVYKRCFRNLSLIQIVQYELNYPHAFVRMLTTTNPPEDAQEEDEIDVSKLLPLYESDDSIDKHVQQVTNVKFDTLGPAVVTETGKLRFFEDWEGKTEQEKDDILKIIIPRNQKRIKELQLSQTNDQTTTNPPNITSFDPTTDPPTK